MSHTLTLSAAAAVLWLAALSGPAAAAVRTADNGKSEPAAAPRVAEPAPAVAPADVDAARRLFGKAPGKAKVHACFERTYDAAHLAKHPLQQVGSMLLLVGGEVVPEDAKVNYAFSLGLKYRNGKAFTSGGACGHVSIGAGDALTAHCGVECDGGSLEVAFAADGRSALVSVERVAVWPEGAAGSEDDRTDFTAGADDKSFRLQRVPVSQCLPLVTDKDELAALRGSR